MPVGVDQSGHEGSAGPVEHDSTGIEGSGIMRNDRGDLVANDGDVRRIAERGRGTIENPDIAEHGDGLRGND